VKLAARQVLPRLAEYSIPAVVARTAWPAEADASEVGVAGTVTLPPCGHAWPFDEE
jgi:hypothetical protein